MLRALCVLLLLAVSLPAQAVQMDFIVLGDQLAMVQTGGDGVGSLPRLILLPGDFDVRLPDSTTELATVGISWCWTPPGPMNTPTEIPMSATADHLDAAVGKLKQEIQELLDMGFTPTPGACDTPAPPLGPVSHP